MITDFERTERETRSGLRERYELYLTFSTDQYVLTFDEWLNEGGK